MQHNIVYPLSFYFFFSSRTRHTRWPRDWSSDVCSSDLRPASFRRYHAGSKQAFSSSLPIRSVTAGSEIGRASCRERVLVAVGGGVLQDDKDELGCMLHF